MNAKEKKQFEILEKKNLELKEKVTLLQEQQHDSFVQLVEQQNMSSQLRTELTATERSITYWKEQYNNQALRSECWQQLAVAFINLGSEVYDGQFTT